MIKKLGDHWSEGRDRHVEEFLCQSVMSSKLGQVQGAVGATQEGSWTQPGGGHSC